MDTRKVTFFATIAAIVLVAVGIGYAYTAMTTNTGNTVGEEYITLTQGNTGEYQFAKEGTNVYWDSNDFKTNAANDGAANPRPYDTNKPFKTMFSLASTVIKNDAAKGVPGYDVVKIGDSFDVKATQTSVTDNASVLCQINASNFNKLNGLDIILKIENATAENSKVYYKLVDNNTFRVMDGSTHAISGDNQFTINQLSRSAGVTTFRNATITAFCGYESNTYTNNGILVERALSSEAIVGPDQNVLSSGELKFAIHALGANNPGTVKVEGISIPETDTMAVGAADKALTVTWTPEAPTNTDVTFESSNASVATIVDGKVHAVAAGVTIITAISSEGNLIDTCVMTITSA